MTAPRARRVPPGSGRGTRSRCDGQFVKNQDLTCFGLARRSRSGGHDSRAGSAADGPRDGPARVLQERRVRGRYFGHTPPPAGQDFYRTEGAHRARRAWRGEGGAGPRCPQPHPQEDAAGVTAPLARRVPPASGRGARSRRTGRFVKNQAGFARWGAALRGRNLVAMKPLRRGMICCRRRQAYTG